MYFLFLSFELVLFGVVCFEIEVAGLQMCPGNFA